MRQEYPPPAGQWDQWPSMAKRILIISKIVRRSTSACRAGGPPAAVCTVFCTVMRGKKPLLGRPKKTEDDQTATRTGLEPTGAGSV